MHENDNAAPLYDKALSLLMRSDDGALKHDPLTLRLITKPAGELTTDEWNTLQSRLDEYEPSIELLLRASSKPGCRRALDYDRGWSMLVRHLSAGPIAADLIAADARLHLRNGRVENVWPRIHAIMALGRSMLAEPMTIAQETRIVIVEKGLDLLEETLGTARPSDAWIEQFLKSTDPAESDAAMKRAFLGNFASTMEALQRHARGEPTGTEIDGWQPPGAAARFRDRARCVRLATATVHEMNAAMSLWSKPVLERDERLDLVMRSAESSYRGVFHGDLVKPWRRQRWLDTRRLMAVETMRRIGDRAPGEGTPNLMDALFGRPIQFQETEEGFVLFVDAKEAEIYTVWRGGRVLRWEFKRRR